MRHNANAEDKVSPDPQVAQSRLIPVTKRVSACNWRRGALAVLFFFLMLSCLAWVGCSSADPKPTTARAAAAAQGVPVGVATAAQRDMPVYLTGLGSVTAYNT